MPVLWESIREGRPSPKAAVSTPPLTVSTGLSAPWKLTELAFSSRRGSFFSEAHSQTPLIYSHQGYGLATISSRSSLHSSGFSPAASRPRVQTAPPAHSEATLLISSQDTVTFLHHGGPPEHCPPQPTQHTPASLPETHSPTRPTHQHTPETNSTSFLQRPTLPGEHLQVSFRHSRPVPLA